MATAALVLGILSVVLSVMGACTFYISIIGAALGIIAIVLGVKGKTAQPEKEGAAKAGLIMGIIGLAAGVVFTIACGFIIGGAAAASQAAAQGAM